MDKKAIIFDLDGTLWDSSKEVASSWSEITLLEPKPFIITQEAMMSAMGLAMPDIARKIMPNYYEDEEKMLLLDRCMEHENHYLVSHPGTLYPDVRKTLSLLRKNYHLMIMSNAQKGYIEAFLAGTNLSECFDDFTCWGEYQTSKSENILRLIKRNNIARAIYVGDTLKDEGETHKAGIPFVHAQYGFGKAINPEAKISKFSELPLVANNLL